MVAGAGAAVRASEAAGRLTAALLLSGVLVSMMSGAVLCRAGVPAGWREHCLLARLDAARAAVGAGGVGAGAGAGAGAGSRA